MLSTWRQISGVGLKSKYGTKTMEHNDPRMYNINALANRLDSILRRFASAGGDEGRVQNMMELLKRAARFGLMLFTQPTEWAFDWEEARYQHTSEIVVFPALSQTADDQGRPIAHPHHGEEAQTVHMS